MGLWKSVLLRNVHIITSSNSSFDKALLSVAEGFGTNGIGVSSGKVISCTFLSGDKHSSINGANLMALN